MNKTNITWADYTWNPISGCSKGCSYCYARMVTQRWPECYPNGFEPTFRPDRLHEPQRRKKPSIIFVGSMGDLFDPYIQDDYIKAVFNQMECDAPQHTYMLLTKQVSRMMDFVDRQWLRPNILFGVTVTCMDDMHRLEVLTKKAKRVRTFVSFEPLLDRVAPDATDLDALELAIVGGRSPGRALHVAHPDWLDVIIDQCRSAGVPVHYKHQGKNPEHGGKVYAAMVEKGYVMARSSNH